MSQRRFEKQEIVGCLIKSGERIHDNGQTGTLYKNRDYSVCLYGDHMTIQRRDHRPARDWRAIQKIKNSLWGEEQEAIEIYPAESRVVDLANTTWLWKVPPDTKPIGFFKGRCIADETGRILEGFDK
jgi:hypothetical protein